MCFFHVLKNLEPYFKKLRDRNEYRNLRNDIHALQTCKNPTTFQKACTLFEAEWTKKEDTQVVECVQYFIENWIRRNNKWYEGVAVGYPSTNNGIEGTNATIKQQHTFRECLPVGQFLMSLEDLVSKWSTVRNPASVNCVPFKESPSISLKAWTEAFQWVMSKKIALEKDNLYYVASSQMKEPLSKKLLSQFLNKEGKWRTFKEFKKWNYGIWIIHIDAHNLHNSSCTCPSYLKFLQCKHILGMHIRLKLVHVPAAAKLIPLGQKSKRGRPSMAKRALIHQ